MRPVFGLVLIFGAGSYTSAADIPSLIQRIKSSGREGAGNVDARDAWKELSQLPSSNVPHLLTALDDASPAAANWLRSAIEVIIERERAAGRSLPAAPLEAFLRDVNHQGRARRFAYELLCQADPTASRRWLPQLLNDPSAELRFEAISVAFDAVKSLPSDAVDAKVELRKLLAAARDGKQIEDIAKELERRGDKVDLVTHFGFITRWQIAGVFDNTDGKGYATEFAPERGIELKTEYAGKGGAKVKWRPHTTTDKAGIVDLNAIFPDPQSKRSGQGKILGQKAAVAYAFAEVDSTAPRDIEVRAASSPAIKVFVNGREVLARESYHQSFDRDSHTATARLNKGRNSILVKICQNNQTEAWAQNWMYQLRLTDPLGAAVTCTVVTPETEQR